MAKKVTKSKKNIEEGVKKKVTKKRRVSRVSKEVPILTKEEELELKKVIFYNWLEIPSQWRGLDENMLRRYGIEEPEDIELCQIINQVEFAKKYKLHVNTLTKWKRAYYEGDGGHSKRKNWVKARMKDVNAAVFNNVLIHGDSSRATYLAKYAGELEDQVAVRSEELSKLTRMFQDQAKNKNEEGGK